MRIKRNASNGSHLIHLAGLILLGLMASTISTDFGFYFAAQNRLQTSADAAALAATSELYRSNAVDPGDRQDDATGAAEDYVDENTPGLTLDSGDVTFGFVDPATKRYDADNFATATNSPNYAMTGGYNAVRVVVRRTNDSSNGPITTVMARMLGIDSMEGGAYSVAFLDRSIATINNGGLRPIYACQAQLNAAMSDYIPENNVIRIYGDRMEVDGVSDIAGCPQPGSGNWGFADLRNCDPDVPGANDTASWFNSGFNGAVHANQCYSTQSGNFLTNSSVQNALNRLIANRTVITIPVYNSYSGGGADTNVHVSGFAGFVITGYTAQGSSNNRHITGYFTRAICRTECRTSTDGTGSGGIVVRLRLASHS